MKQFKDAIQISGGERITSGIVGANSIRDLKVTSSVCDQEDISIGSACASALDITIIARGGNLSIKDGTKIYLQHEYADGKYYQDGVYFCSQPVQKSQNTYKVTAYDAVSRLDKDLTEWLSGLTGWPYTVTQFAQDVCKECGLALANSPPHNSGYLVQKFVAGRITGRQLMKWCAEIGGAFVRANWKGEIIFDWYKSYESEFAADGSHAYRSGSLNHADYSTQPIDAVRIQLTEDDVGVIFPPDGNPKNVYDITANYLLTTDNPKALAPVAESLYNVLKGVTYTPCKLKVDAIYAIDPSKLAAGSIVPIVDQNGKKIRAYITKTVRSGITMSLESTGNESRSSVPAINDVSLGVLNHKMFELRKSVSGFDARITDVSTSSKEAVRKVNELSATVDGYTGRISAVEQSSKQATDKVNELSVTVGGFDGRISSVETTANGASKKVNELSVTVDGYSGRISNAEKTANGASQKVAELSADTDAIKLSLSSTQIGGDNLLPGSADMKKYSTDTGGVSPAKPALSYGEDGSLTVTNSGSNITVYMRANDIVPGRKYVFSILFKQISGENTVNFTWLGRSADNGYLESNIYHLPGGTVGSKTANATDMGDGWEKVWFEVHPTDKRTTWMQLYPRAGEYKKPATNKFILLHPMLEEGTIPSAWTEAQGDITKAAEAKLEVSLGEIRSTVSSIEKTAGDAKSAADDAALKAGNANKSVSELSQTVNGFETRVSQAETTANGAKEAASSAKQTADSVSAEVSGKVDVEAGDWQKFGWHLTRDQWSVYSGGHTVLGVTDAGAELDGKITARSGSIGGWGIDGSSIFYEDTANGKSLVMSINGGLYGGTGDREWHIRQNGAALFRSAEIYGDIYANNGFFKGTVYAGNISYGGDSGYVSGKCLSNNSVTTTETSTGINGSLGRADFSNDVFQGKATAPYGAFTNLAVSKIAFGANAAVEVVPVKIKVQTDQGLKELSLVSWFRS